MAEAGVNHDGDVRTALALVEAAAHAGADAVKFQAFRADALVTRKAPIAGYQKTESAAQTQHELLRRLELSADAFRTIAEHCRRCGVEFLATPFGIGDLAMLCDLNVRAVKIASPDLRNTPLLRAAVDTHLPLLISTGAAEPHEIEATMTFLHRLGADRRTAFLHCVSRYPTPPHEANLRRIRRLADFTGRPVGFSDHTSIVEAGALAVAAGAVILEKHLTLDRHRGGPDHSFSLEPDQLADYIAAVRRIEPWLGDGGLALRECEREVRRIARPSVVAAVAIPAGHRIERRMLTVKRPGTGIPPESLEQVVGRAARCDIPADTPLTWEMVQ